MSVGLARDTGGRIIGAGLTLHLKLTKADVAGESGAVRVFVLDDQPSSLSVAAAIKAILEKDLTVDDKEQTPLFRYP